MGTTTRNELTLSFIEIFSTSIKWICDSIFPIIFSLSGCFWDPTCMNWFK